MRKYGILIFVFIILGIAGYGEEIVNVAAVGQSFTSAGQDNPSKFGKFSKFAGAGLSAMHSYATSQHTLIGTVKTYEGSGEINLPLNITCFYDWGGNPDFLVTLTYREL